MQFFDPQNPATLRPWLVGHVCPFWLERIRDTAGGFFENLAADGNPAREARRTTLVQARLTYTFSHAFVLSADAGFRQAAVHGMEFLLRACRAADGGWLRAATVDGTALDATRDAYDHAFVLLALAWYARATGDLAAIQLADSTWQFMQERLADRRYGGFAEEYVPGGSAKLPRRQNPHMHLLEALLALHAATGEKNWLRRAAALVGLFKARFVDPATGALGEFFAADWSPAPGPAGALREPGHQFEWVWLLFEFYRHTGDETVIPHAERLFAFGAAFGLEPNDTVQGAVFDGIDAAGNLVADTKLLWPQTEFIKACAARAEFLADATARQSIRAHLALIQRHFMRPDGASWHNQLARDGTPLAPVTPARVLYHLFMAVAEAERVLSQAST
jgi:mannose/cellobiose epimerase-like protein (N-acyl-D-glucosamine 2-epimerase family)